MFRVDVYIRRTVDLIWVDLQPIKTFTWKQATNKHKPSSKQQSVFKSRSTKT